jgi:hypothetical protein
MAFICMETGPYMRHADWGSTVGVRLGYHRPLLASVTCYRIERFVPVVYSFAILKRYHSVDELIPIPIPSWQRQGDTDHNALVNE